MESRAVNVADDSFSVMEDAWRLYRRHPGIWSLAILIVVIGYGAISGTVLAALGLDRPVGRGGFRLPLTPGAGACNTSSRP